MRRALRKISEENMKSDIRRIAERLLDASLNHSRVGRLTLHRQGHSDLRPPARTEALLHAGAQPAEQRHVRGFRENPEA